MHTESTIARLVATRMPVWLLPTVRHVPAGVDVGTDGGCQALSDLEHDRIDLIINNAGKYCKGSLDDLNFDDIRECFEINSLGPLRTFKAIESKLKAGSKIMVVGSLMGSMAQCDNIGGDRVCHCQFKYFLFN